MKLARTRRTPPSTSRSTLRGCAPAQHSDGARYVGVVETRRREETVPRALRRRRQEEASPTYSPPDEQPRLVYRSFTHREGSVIQWIQMRPPSASRSAPEGVLRLSTVSLSIAALAVGVDCSPTCSSPYDCRFPPVSLEYPVVPPVVPAVTASLAASPTYSSAASPAVSPAVSNSSQLLLQNSYDRSIASFRPDSISPPTCSRVSSVAPVYSAVSPAAPTAAADPSVPPTCSSPHDCRSRLLFTAALEERPEPWCSTSAARLDVLLPFARLSDVLHSTASPSGHCDCLGDVAGAPIHSSSRGALVAVSQYFRSRPDASPSLTCHYSAPRSTASCPGRRS